jgi:sec-independent protein translocase protein TatA
MTDTRGNEMGPVELFLILGIVLLIFGATRLPRLARSMGKAPDEFKAGLAESPDDHRSGPPPSDI